MPALTDSIALPYNVWQDKFGSAPENSRRFLLETFQAVRDALGLRFPVSVKLNSADFTRGGLSEAESLDVVRSLPQVGCALIEISGGTYENPMMMLGQGQRAGFFTGFSRQAWEVAGVPVGVTGGFRDSDTVREAISSGAADRVGLGRPLALDPDFAGKLLRGERASVSVTPRKTGIKALDRSGTLETVWYEDALRRIARGQTVNPDENMTVALLRIVGKAGWKAALSRRRA